MLGHLTVSGDHSLYIFYFNFTFGYVRGPGVSFWRWVLEKPAYLGAFYVQPVLLAMEELNLCSSADVRNLFSLLMLPKFNPLHLLLLWLGWIFPRVSSVDTVKSKWDGGHFFLQIPLTKPCQISQWSVTNPFLSLLGLSRTEHVISSDPWHLHCLSCTWGWGMFSWEKVLSLTVLCEH